MEDKKSGQINEIIKTIMKEQGVSQIIMAKAIGKQRANDVSSRLLNSNMTIDSIIEMLDILGYEVVVQKRTAGNRGKDQFLVDKSNGQTKKKKDIDAKKARAEGQK